MRCDQSSSVETSVTSILRRRRQTFYRQVAKFYECYELFISSEINLLWRFSDGRSCKHGWCWTRLHRNLRFKRESQISASSNFRSGTKWCERKRLRTLTYQGLSVYKQYCAVHTSEEHRKSIHNVSGTSPPWTILNLDLIVWIKLKYVEKLKNTKFVVIHSKKVTLLPLYMVCDTRLII